MKILLLGAGGQLGWELQRSLAPLGELHSLERGRGDLCGDLGDPGGLANTIRMLRPDIIVNAAAYTAVDRAESETALAEAVNTTGPAVLAEEAKALGAVLVHYSTDYVFDGSGHVPRSEDSPTRPLSVYGRTKLQGEDAIRQSGCRHLVLRTSWVHASRGANFAKTMLRLSKEKPELKVIDDQFGAPTGADLLADVTAHALTRHDLIDATHGTYHVTASGEVSWHGYARFVIGEALRRGAKLALQVSDIHPIPTSAYPTAAARPLNSRLDTTRFRSTFGLVLPPWQSGVERLVAELTAPP